MKLNFTEYPVIVTEAGDVKEYKIDSTLQVSTTAKNWEEAESKLLMSFIIKTQEKIVRRDFVPEAKNFDQKIHMHRLNIPLNARLKLCLSNYMIQRDVRRGDITAFLGNNSPSTADRVLKLVHQTDYNTLFFLLEKLGVQPEVTLHDVSSTRANSTAA